MTRHRDDELTNLDPDERELAELLAEAGPRTEPPREDLDAALAAARFAWARRVGTRRAGEHAIAQRGERTDRAPRATRVRIALAVAALAAAVLVTFGIRLSGPGAGPAPAAMIASVEVAVGALEQLDGDRWSPLGAGAQIPAGTVLRTGPDGRAALRTAAGASLRFDRSSRWALPSASRVELAAGSLYADTGDASGLVVATAIGEARDIGTRFAVRVEADSMRVGVRDGAVLVDRGAQRYRAERGVELRVPRAGEPERGELASFGEAWAWTLEVAPAFELEGSTLADFLDWLEAETGWSVAYDQDAVGEPAERIVLHGSLEGVSPLDAPALVLPGAEVSYRLEGGVLVIE